MTSTAVRTALVSPRLNPGDRVRFVSPASTPDRELVAKGVELVTGWGLQVELGEHVFDSFGYLAGADDDRLADLNDAFRDPGVRAIFATRGGKGAYRIADGLDFDAVRRDPKPLIGFSDITALHLALWNQVGLAGIHGPSMSWYEPNCGPECAEALRRALMTTTEVVVHQDPNELSAALTEGEAATGFLMGGNLDTVRCAIGADLPSLAGGILLIEVNHGTGLGMVDRQLTQLLRSGLLDGLRGVAVGQITGFEDDVSNGWTVLDVLRDRLAKLDVPVLGGLPIGHGPQPATTPLGTLATINPTAGTLTAAPAVQ
ncbi:LD-carboxypeptidase [Kribbella sp. NPDC004875]|uniref:S66 peptidase family protein n=1 Tax=Kribbella sp. NPDC004875 TaxID=3364107 RepID=UPI003691ECF2